MSQVDAIYQNGVFKPLQDVGLPDNQRVRLSVHPVEAADIQAWLERARGAARPGVTTEEVMALTRGEE